MSDDTRDQIGPGRYDFGDDAAETPQDEPAFDTWLRRTAPALNTPGTAPAQQMWDVIQARQTAALAAAEGRIAGVRPLRRHRWLLPATIAAALLAGVALDRIVIMRSAGDDDARLATTGAPVTPRTTLDSAEHTDLYRLAAVQTLSQAEALLTAYRARGAAVRSDPAARQLGGWAREVLGSTRLLIDSPAGADPQLRPLLNDIELVLVQIVRLSGAPLDSTDRALIDRALRERDLLPRIRTAVPAGTAEPVIASDD